MPVLPNSLKQTSPEGPSFSTFNRALNPNPRVGAFGNAHIAGQLSKGLNDFATGSAQLARVAGQEADRFREEAIANTLAQSRDLEIIAEARESANLDGSGYADNVLARLEAHDAELLGRLPNDEATLRRFREVRSQRVGQLYQRALAAELDMRTSYGVAQAEESIRQLTNAVTADPRERERAIREGRAVIQAIPGRSSGERRLMADEFERNITLTGYTAMLQNAESAAQVAEVERYLREEGRRELEPRDYERMLKAARAQRRSLAVRAQREAKAEVSSFAEVLEQGLIPTEDETAAMVAAAQASADPDWVEAAARASALREASVNRADMPLDVQMAELETLRAQAMSGALDEAGRIDLAIKENVLNASVQIASEDTVAYLRRAGVEVPEVVRVEEEGGLAVDAVALVDRAQLVMRESAKLGLLPGEVKVFTPRESRQILGAISEDPALVIDIAEAAGSLDAPTRQAVVRQLGAGELIASTPVRAVEAGASPQTVSDIANGAQILREDGTARQRFGLNGDEGGSFSEVTALIPTLEGEEVAAWKAAADAAYVREAQAQGYTSFQPERYRALALRTQGLREIEVNGAAVAIPETSKLTGASIEAAFELAASEWHTGQGIVAPSEDRLKVWAVDGLTSGPRTITGRAVSIEEVIDDGEIVHMGGDVYAVRMGDGGFLVAEGPQGPNGTFPRYMFRMPDDFLQRERTAMEAARGRYQDAQPTLTMESRYSPSGDGYLRRSDYAYLTTEQYDEELLDLQADTYGRFSVGYEDFDEETGEDVIFYSDRLSPGEFIRGDEVIRRRNEARAAVIERFPSRLGHLKPDYEAEWGPAGDWLTREVGR